MAAAAKYRVSTGKLGQLPNRVSFIIRVFYENLKAFKQMQLSGGKERQLKSRILSCMTTCSRKLQNKTAVHNVSCKYNIMVYLQAILYKAFKYILHANYERLLFHN
jgi:hypothetical protein